MGRVGGMWKAVPPALGVSPRAVGQIPKMLSVTFPINFGAGPFVRQEGQGQPGWGKQRRLPGPRAGSFVGEQLVTHFPIEEGPLG